MDNFSLTDLFNQFVSFVEKDSGLMASGLILEEFSSKNPVHRLNIRLGIVESNLLSPADHEKILDLSQRPKSSDYFFSISHTESFGGYVQSDQLVGFDIEQSHRVQQKIIQRVSSAAEMASAPGADYLWTAKEAVFKALSLDVMSRSEILNWQACTHPQTYKFHIQPITEPSLNYLKLKHNTGYSQRVSNHNWTIFFF